MRQIARLVRQGTRAVALGALAASLGACATAQTGADPLPPREEEWTLRTREHVDLWLHGFALLTDDTARVRHFAPGYRAEIEELKRAMALQSALDANRPQLRARLESNPALVNAQFVALYFANLEDLERAVEITLRVGGQAGQVSDPVLQRVVSVMATYFPVAADREWLRLFMLGLRDEHQRFYRQFWAQREGDRFATFAAVDSLWRTTYQPRFRRFLNNTQQPSGDFLLSLPLGAEGRVLREPPVIAATFPAQPARAIESIYVFAHEMVATMASSVVEDNITPAERREGRGALLMSLAAVRGGAMVLQRVAPELADGYARFYLTAVQVQPPAQNVQQVLATVFPLPEVIEQSLSRQIDIVLGGF